MSDGLMGVETLGGRGGGTVPAFCFLIFPIVNVVADSESIYAVNPETCTVIIQIKIYMTYCQIVKLHHVRIKISSYKIAKLLIWKIIHCNEYSSIKKSWIIVTLGLLLSLESTLYYIASRYDSTLSF